MDGTTSKSSKKRYIPLFWKFAIAVSSMVILFGSLNLLFIRYQVYLAFEAQIERQGVSIAKSVAEQVVEPILYNEIASVNRALLRTKAINTDIDYLIILSPNNSVLAHTLPTEPSQGLIDANKLSVRDSVSIKIIHSKSDNNKTIRDFTTPIMDGRLGFLRVGMSEETINRQLLQATRLFILLVFILLYFNSCFLEKFSSPSTTLLIRSMASVIISIYSLFCLILSGFSDILRRQLFMPAKGLLIS